MQKFWVRKRKKMKKKGLSLAIALIALGSSLTACSHHDNNSGANSAGSKNMIRVDLGSDIATLDPQLTEDVQSSRVAYDLFEGLTSQDQSNKPIAGLANKWEISADGKTYTFYLRPGIKFSNGAPMSANDVVFTFRRLASPKLGSTYNFLIAGIVNGQNIIDGKAAPQTLGVKALNAHTVQISLAYPDPAFLSICAQPDLGIVSQANVKKFGQAWTNPRNMATSGAYKLDERVVHGYILESKNPYYYDAKNVAINKVKFFPIVDFNSSLNLYKSGGLDITYLLPVDQYKSIKAEMDDQEHTVAWETIEYYDFNMSLPKFKNNPKLRQALTMAVDREALVTEVLGQDQKPLYANVTSTIEGGKFAGLDYAWAKWPRDKQIATAQQLFKEAGYGPTHPLRLTVSYNTRDLNRKNALAIAAMWQQVFGADSIQTNAANQEWKTFLQARTKGDFEIARDGWVADYDSVSSYTALYQCGNLINHAKSCTPGFNDLIAQAQNSADSTQRINLIRQALQKAMAEYNIIPLYQDTYYRLVNPRVKGYTPETNHLDHVMSKWYRF